MFNLNEPNNTLPFLPRVDFNFNDLDLLKQLNKTNIAITKLNWITNKIPNPDILLEFISIKEWVKSNEIEEIRTTVWDAFISELFENIAEKSPEKETINYKDAIYYGYEKIKSKWWLWYNDIVRINKIITNSDAGIISSPNKKIENWAWITLYTPPIWIALIKELVYNLEAYYNSFNEEEEIDPLLKLPLLHYQFEAIHPFWDWNWRTWRILMVLYFVLYKKLDLPILFLSDYITQYKSDYYQHLRNIDKNSPWAIKDFTMWILLLIQAQALETENIILDIQLLMIKLEQKLVIDRELEKIYSKELIDFIFIRPFYSIQKLESYLSIHRNTASKYLNLLEEKWIFHSKKIKGKKIFYYKDFLDLLDS